ncbi:hypothetical protein BDU57DRAFT_558349 [Ampelomyces quisqualis]|uniref:Uncharacterized protein n=1 Tax=Ampelomyces quisqualis TaxID=50730 RepID=A0A6A5QHE6_AMPQU|nr:hypothetical protein BDU57DRAFT_558349 [Ampelomyces quisqualis]
MDCDPVPPSSPPHATSTNAPSSPFFEQQNDAFSPKSSSPPPLFSSDDSRESADLVNYQSPRIFKNKRKGTWWDNTESAHNAPNSKKARMTRNFDSGVYMMSDGTDGSESLLPPHKSPFDLDGTCDMPFEDGLEQRPLGEEEKVFCNTLYAGLDKNSLVYDFSYSSLQDSDIGRIGQLASVIKNLPDPGNEVPAEGQYRSMVPELYVNLSHNRLHRLTPSLFDVQNLTTLVLTGNNIEELPAQICNLRNLRELNISLNQIRWLPFDFLKQFSDPAHNLSILGDSGVPWLMPDIPRLIGGLDPSPSQSVRYSLYDNQDADFERERDMFTWCLRTFRGHEAYRQYRSGNMPLYIARTQVSYFDQTGELLCGSSKLPMSSRETFAVLTDTNFGTHGIPASNWFAPPNPKVVTSLLTMSLHNTLRYRHEEDLSIDNLRCHIGDPVPSAADALLKQAERNNAGGYGDFKKCNICKREYIVARAEWIEWWLTQKQMVLPFKVQVCSWGCVPDAMLKRPDKFTLV